MEYLSTVKVKDLINRLPNPNEYEYNTYRFEILPKIEFCVKMTPQFQKDMMPKVVVFIKVKSPIPNKYEWAMEM